MTTTHHRLDELMRQTGISQNALAKTVGVHPTTIMRWRYGRQSLPSEYVVPLAREFGVTVDRFLGQGSG